MKLCYIWIEKFKNFVNFEINLSNKYKFSFNPATNSIVRKELPELPKDLFPSTFSSITGLIGRNGVGKSSALELICNSLKGAKTSLKSDFFMIVDETDAETGRSNMTAYYSLTGREIPKFRGLKFLPHPGSIEDLKVVFFLTYSITAEMTFIQTLLIYLQMQEVAIMHCIVI